MRVIEESELIVNNDKSIYHLHITAEQLADDIIVVGDPQRVELISSYFDTIEHKVHNREFITHTGYYHGKRLTVLATGIGTDNIDIVINELDALVNIDFKTRKDNENKRQLTILRIGTSGAIQKDIVPGTFLASRFALGFDGLLNFYRDRDLVSNHELEEAFINQTGWDSRLPAPYICECSSRLDVLAGKAGLSLITYILSACTKSGYEQSP